MTLIISIPLGAGRTKIIHEPSGTEITSEIASATGQTFSSTDLVAAGLGSCMSSSIETLAERHGVPFESIIITVEKETTSEPKRISRLATVIEVSVAYDKKIHTLFSRAAATCTVHASLHPDIDAPVEVTFTAQSRRTGLFSKD